MDFQKESETQQQTTTEDKKLPSSNLKIFSTSSQINRQLTRQITTAKSFLSMQNFEFKIYSIHSFNKEITRNKGIQSWIVQDDWLEVYVAWKYNFDDNELVIKHKVSHHLDFLSEASHSPVTHNSMKKCSLGRSLNGFISNQSAWRFYQQSAAAAAFLLWWLILLWWLLWRVTWAWQVWRNVTSRESGDIL